jgi:hypothetical protein
MRFAKQRVEHMCRPTTADAELVQRLCIGTAAVHRGTPEQPSLQAPYAR